MIKQSDIFADMHTHTIFSLHAYSTIEENLRVAKERGLKYIAITDHYYQDGTENYKKNENTRNRYMEERINAFKDVLGVEVISSAEFNLGQYPERGKYWNKVSELRYRPIGFHSFGIEREVLDYNDVYNMFEDSIPYYTTFAHIERELNMINHKKYGEGLNDSHKKFLDSIVFRAVKNNILLEVNESSLISNTGGSADRLKYWINTAKDMRALIVLGSDAHFSLEVGNFENSIKLLNDINYPEDLILNCNEELFKERLNLK